MNIGNNFVRQAIFVLIISTISAIPAAAHATVGGPTYIYSFKYNPANESVYFIRQDNGGRGCPPELFKMSLVTGKTDVVFSCSQGESLMTANNNDGVGSVNRAIDNIVKNFKDITPISLPKNNIAVDIDFVKSEKWSPEDDFIVRSQFIAKVFQDTTKIADLPITGCLKDQPFVFAGYAIPGFEKKILLLLSATSDCNEGGYTNETLHIIDNIGHLERTYEGNSWKNVCPLIPSIGTLVVFERDSIGANVMPTGDSKPVYTATTTVVEPTNSQDNIYPYVLFAMGAVIGAIIGLFLNALIFRGRRNDSLPTIGTT